MHVAVRLFLSSGSCCIVLLSVVPPLHFFAAIVGSLHRSLDLVDQSMVFVAMGAPMSPDQYGVEVCSCVFHAWAVGPRELGPHENYVGGVQVSIYRPDDLKNPFLPIISNLPVAERQRYICVVVLLLLRVSHPLVCLSQHRVCQAADSGARVGAAPGIKAAAARAHFSHRRQDFP